MDYEKIIENKFRIAKQYLDICNSLNIEFINQSGDFFNGNYYKFTIISPKENISDFLSKVKTTTSKVYDYALGNSKEIPTKHLCLPIWFDLEESTINQIINEIKRSR